MNPSIAAQLLTYSLLLGPVTSALAAVPSIADIAEQTVQASVTLRVLPTLLDPQGGPVNWTKAYGPDAASVDPETGEVVWTVPANLPGESFHIGVRASRPEGASIETFIVHVGNSPVVHVGPSEADQSLSAAFANHTQAGTRFVIRNGRYTGVANAIVLTAPGSFQLPPAGTSSRFTTVISEDPGMVTLAQGAEIRINGTIGPYGYVAFKGLFVENGSISSFGYNAGSFPQCSGATTCRPHHIKFVQNGAQSAGDEPFQGFRSDDILFENNYAFGGGRYKFTSFQSNRIVFRRNVSRYDRSNNEMAEPKGNYSIYTTMNASVSNNIAVDGDQSQFVTTGQLAGEFTCPVTSGHTRVTFDRNVQLNSEMLYGNIDNQASSGGGTCDAEIRDLVSWDIRPAGVYVMTRAASWFEHATMGRVRPRLISAPQLFNGWPSNFARGITNSVLHDFQNGDMFFGLTRQQGVFVIDRTVDRYGVDRVNISNVPGVLNVGDSTLGVLSSVPPLYSASHPTGGLRYLPRIEANSNLSHLGEGGTALGATVMTFKGRSGSFWGEAGFNEETGIPMWPFPLQELIGEKMAAYSYTGTTYSGDEYNRIATGTGTINGNRGFATSGQTLSEYVWGYLGSTVPPFHVSARIDTQGVHLRWEPPAPIARATLNGYRVYDYDPDDQTISNPRDLSAQVNALLISTAAAGTARGYVVTAIDSVRGESGYGYPVLVNLDHVFEDGFE